MKTFLERFNEEPQWDKRAIILDLFHSTKLLKNNKWTITDTARIMKISKSHVSEDLMIVKFIKIVSYCKSRNQALKLIRSINNGRKDLSNSRG